VTQPSASISGPAEEDSGRSAPRIVHSNDSKRSIATKPVPEIQRLNPREFQINQVIRRFKPQRRDDETATLLDFTILPSDPDFPFELQGLHCELKVPRDYPVGRPTLRVRNPEIPRGYQINIERGFDGLAQSIQRTLLTTLNELDKALERFLTSEKAQTVKLVANASRSPEALRSVAQPFPTDAPKAPTQRPLPEKPKVMYAVQQKDQAQIKRTAEVRQLIARMSRNSQFSKSADETSFTIPVQIPQPEKLPASLRALKQVSLLVPILYPLEPCRIQLQNVASEQARAVEEAFVAHSFNESSLTLMAHINFLIQNIHEMAATSKVESKVLPSQPMQEVIEKNSAAPTVSIDNDALAAVEDDRAHIQFIPRPPEWDAPADASEEEFSDYEESDDESSAPEDGNSEDDGGAMLPERAAAPTATANSIILSFPNIELYGIELLQLASLGLVLKCDRCKSNVEIETVKSNNASGSTSSNLTESCPKCAASLLVSFVAEPVHANSIKAGRLELTACTVSDMMVSTFTPTCADCSTAYPTPPGMTAVRGDAALAVCRNCHRRMSFRIHETKFLRVASHASGVPLPPRRRKQKEDLGITTGTPLPDFGICSHYRKSRRWFRFSCCGKVYPCDRCHDEQADPKHPNEHANRMLCGFCSREQNFRPEDCGACGRILTGRRGGGFWEGGKGTRDKVKMSRKDPRKYKRRGGNAPLGG
jgi:uncharacterized CHY-type Zn-finger protein